MPTFNFSDFLEASRIYLSTHPSAMGLLSIATGLLIYKTIDFWFVTIKASALRRVLRDTTEREAHTERLREDLLKSIAQAKGIDNPRRFR